MEGCSVIAQSLYSQGIRYVFGIVGIPIIELGMALQEAGVHYIGTRNEQAASYAASAIGYLTDRPAVCLVVPGPGLIHALAGMANAAVNCWPMIVLAGSYDQDQGGMGGFQEWNQMESCRQYVKYAVRLETMESIPFHVEKAVRTSIYGRPGVAYIEVPGNMVTDRIDPSKIKFLPAVPDPPRMHADPANIRVAVDVLKNAKKPLVIVGKGAAYSRAEVEVADFIVSNALPFLPTPMGKGILPDDNPMCVAAARSKALQEADVVVLLGARLNWILHFGKPPRFSANVKFIQVDVSPEEMSNNASGSVMLLGDVKAVVSQLLDEVRNRSLKSLHDKSSFWWKVLEEKRSKNLEINKELAAIEELPMSFYCAYKVINRHLPRECILINEGSTTMDIGRTALFSYHPRRRMDAGTFGTMGVGCGFAIAAALVEQNKPASERVPVVGIQGDSAFGFSGMEFETACRYQLPVIFVVMNNNGIYRGLDGESWESVTEVDSSSLPLHVPPTSLLYGARYDKIASAFGANGYSVRTVLQLDEVMKLVFSKHREGPVIINIEVDPNSTRKPQEHSWLTRSNL